MPNSEAEIEAVLAPSGGQLTDRGAHFRRHAHRLDAGLGARQRIVEDRHQTVTGEVLDRALEFMNDGADGCVVLAQDIHHLFRFGGFGKGGKAAQVAKHDSDVAAVTVENAIVARRQDQLGDLLGQKPLQTIHTFDLRKLLRHAFLEGAIPAGEVCQPARVLGRSTP